MSLNEVDLYSNSVSTVNTETFWVLAAVFGPVILYVAYSTRLDKTQDGMRIRYNEYRKRTGRLRNTNHTTTKQRVARVRWQHRKIDELMVRHFGAERVDQFYHENNVAELRQRDIEAVKMMRP